MNGPSPIIPPTIYRTERFEQVLGAISHVGIGLAAESARAPYDGAEVV